MAQASNPILGSLLKEVSRSFYLTLRIMPAKVRPQLGLAYLLARTTDTIADTELLPVEQRLKALQQLRERIQGARATPIDFGELAQEQSSPAERVLLEKCETSLSLLETLMPPDRQLIRKVLDTITSGQELDLRRFAIAAAGQIVALRTDEELDDYTYRVAGCVGEFWTRICRAHLFPNAPMNESELLANGVRFGKGLQLTNILRDLAADLRQGRCYLPAERLSSVGLAPGDLLQPANEPRLRPVYNALLDLAREHLLAGWAYTNALPWRNVRVRLACSWPILIGLETLKLLRVRNVLDPHQPIKVSRGEVRRIQCLSVILYPWPKAWKAIASSAAFP
jgi:farnesyl-diphosphate farnesyltransferase